jgi:hypothetical protein
MQTIPKPNRTVHLNPDDWDFRGLNPDHFHAALKYELAREHPHLQDALALLTPERRGEIECLTEEDWRWTGHRRPWYAREGWWLAGERFWQLYSVIRACWYCGEFPKPWMALSDTHRRTAVERCGEPYSALRILTREELAWIEFREQMTAKVDERTGHKPASPDLRPIRRYIVEIDWESGDDARLKPLLLGLLKLRPEKIGPRKHHTGKRAALPMHKFKQLAAWRLARKAGLNYKDAWRLVDKSKKESPKDDPLDLLPDYKSAGAWKDAVDAGQKLVQQGW